MSPPRDLGACAFCGTPAVELHHLTARLTPDGPYLDPEATIPLCRRHHATETALWREPEVGLDALADPTLARAARATWSLGRLVDLGRPGTPGVLRSFHVVLVRITDGVAELLSKVAGS